MKTETRRSTRKPQDADAKAEARGKHDARWALKCPGNLAKADALSIFPLSARAIVKGCWLPCPKRGEALQRRTFFAFTFCLFRGLFFFRFDTLPFCDRVGTFSERSRRTLSAFAIALRKEFRFCRIGKVDVYKICSN